jgi:uncharacterized cupredoxin-like copper-binding protein
MKRFVITPMLALLLVACAGGGMTPSTIPSPLRAIAVTLTDEMRIEPDPIEIQAHETVRFVVTNTGSIVHELFIGDETEQAAHEEEMQVGAMAHDHANAVSVDPGETRELTFSFGIPGVALAGCHVPGHYAAGMKAALLVQ